MTSSGPRIAGKFCACTFPTAKETNEQGTLCLHCRRWVDNIKHLRASTALSPRALAFLRSNGSHAFSCALNRHYSSLSRIPLRHTKRYAEARAELDAEGIPACDCGLADLRAFHKVNES